MHEIANVALNRDGMGLLQCDVVELSKVSFPLVEEWPSANNAY